MYRVAALAVLGVLVGACTGGDGTGSTAVEGTVTTSSTVTVTTSQATSSTTTAVAPSTTKSPNSAFALGEARYVDGAGLWIQTVSPDAMTLVVADGDHIGLQPLDAPDGERVLPVPTPPDFRLQRMAGGWSPDGTLLAFHDRSTTAATFQSTVWLLEVTEPSVRSLIDSEGFLALDVAVSADGTVAVTGNDSTRGSGVFTDGGSGEAAPLAQFDGPLHVIDWTADGSYLLLSRSAGEGGLWRLTPGRYGQRELVVADDPVLGSPILMTVSRDGGWALVHYSAFVAAEFPTDVSHVGVVRLDTGDVTPLKEHDGTAGFFGPTTATFSPDGTWVAYTYHRGTGLDDPVVLAIRPTAGGAEQIISSDLFGTVGRPPTNDFLFHSGSGSLNPVWAGDRLVLPTERWVLVIDLD